MTEGIKASLYRMRCKKANFAPKTKKAEKVEKAEKAEKAEQLR